MKPIKPSAHGGLLRYFGMLMVLGQLFAAGPVRGGDPIVQNPDGRQKAHREIFVASNGWHSAIFVPRAAIPSGAIPVVSDFPVAAYLGFGWGDAAYFPNRDPGVLTLLSAALQPTPSVLHVTGLSTHPRDAFPKDEVVSLKISPAGFRKLLARLSATFARDGTGRVIHHAPGLHSFSKFYRATGDFHMLNNCNSWTARGLAAAGLPIDAGSVYLADELMSQVRDIKD